MLFQSSARDHVLYCRANLTVREQPVLPAGVHPRERGDVFLDGRRQPHGHVLVGEDEDAGENQGVRCAPRPA